MTATSRTLLLWGPRLFALAFCAFLSLFAFDVFQEGDGFVESLPAFGVHLFPTLVLLAVVAAAWRWEWLGGLVFIAAAAAYAVVIAPHRPDWMLVISGPLLVAGVAFLWSWRHHDELRAGR
jgi:hypothetical protein